MKAGGEDAIRVLSLVRSTLSDLGCWVADGALPTLERRTGVRADDLNKS
jgi:hypothetical protein